MAWDCSERSSLNKHSGQEDSWLWWDDGDATTIGSSSTCSRGRILAPIVPPKLVPFLAYILIPTRSKYNLLVENLEAVKMSHLCTFQQLGNEETKSIFLSILMHSFPPATPSFSIASFRKSRSHVIPSISRNFVYMLDSSKSASSQSLWR